MYAHSLSSAFGPTDWLHADACKIYLHTYVTSRAFLCYNVFDIGIGRSWQRILSRLSFGLVNIRYADVWPNISIQMTITTIIVDKEVYTQYFRNFLQAHATRPHVSIQSIYETYSETRLLLGSLKQLRCIK